MVVALCTGFMWLAAVVLVLKAVALWRLPGPGGASKRRIWLDGLAGPTAGPARALPAGAFGSVGLALLLTGTAASSGSDKPSPWLGVFAVGLLFMVIAYLVFMSVVLFNRPRFLVPPAYRAEQGRIAAWRSRRATDSSCRHNLGSLRRRPTVLGLDSLTSDSQSSCARADGQLCREEESP